MAVKGAGEVDATHLMDLLWQQSIVRVTNQKQAFRPCQVLLRMTANHSAKLSDHRRMAPEDMYQQQWQGPLQSRKKLDIDYNLNSNLNNYLQYKSFCNLPQKFPHFFI